MLRSSSARVVSHFGFVQKTRRFSGRYSVVLFWLRLGPKLEKRGLRGVFLTLGNHVFCDSPLGAFCVFLSLPFSVICSACSLGGVGWEGLNDVLFRGQTFAAIIKSTTRGKEHATNETTAGGGRGRRHTHPPPAEPTYERAKGSGRLGHAYVHFGHGQLRDITMQASSPSNHHNTSIITKQSSPCKHHHQATITMQTSSPSNHHHANIITKQPSP